MYINKHLPIMPCFVQEEISFRSFFFEGVAKNGGFWNSAKAWEAIIFNHKSYKKELTKPTP